MEDKNFEIVAIENVKIFKQRENLQSLELSLSGYERVVAC